MNWIDVNLPWSRKYRSWEERMPNTDAEERALFGGKTYDEISRSSHQKYQDMREKFYAQTPDQEPRITEQELIQLREAEVNFLYSLLEQVKALPAYKEMICFSSQAKPGMLLETSKGEHILIGDVSANGGIGTEYFPMDGEFIVRYCMLEMPKGQP